MRELPSGLIGALFSVSMSFNVAAQPTMAETEAEVKAEKAQASEMQKDAKAEYVEATERAAATELKEGAKVKRSRAKTNSEADYIAGSACH